MKFKIVNLLPIQTDIRLLSVGKTAIFPTLTKGQPFTVFTPIGLENKYIEAGIRLPAIGEISCANADDHVIKLKLKGNFKVKINDWVSDQVWPAETIETVFNDEELMSGSGPAADGFTELNINLTKSTQIRITITPDDSESVINNADVEGSFTFVDSNGELTFCLKLESSEEGTQTTGAAGGLSTIQFAGTRETPFKATIFSDTDEPIVVNSYEEFETVLTSLGYSFDVKELAD